MPIECDNQITTHTHSILALIGLIFYMAVPVLNFYLKIIVVALDLRLYEFYVWRKLIMLFQQI